MFLFSLYFALVISNVALIYNYREQANLTVKKYVFTKYKKTSVHYLIAIMPKQKMSDKNDQICLIVNDKFVYLENKWHYITIRKFGSKGFKRNKYIGYLRRFKFLISPFSIIRYFVFKNSIELN